MSEIAPMVVACVFFLTTAGVLIMRPLATRLGELLVAMRQERLGASNERAELQHVVHLIEQLNNRMQLIEERQEFTERLIDAARRNQLTGDAQLR